MHVNRSTDLKKIVIAILIFLCVWNVGAAQAQEIILIRHAKVNLNTKGWMGHRKAAQYREAYDTAPVYSFNPDSVLSTLPFRESDTVFVSCLPRSIHTGTSLFADSAAIVSLALFNEFELHIVKWPVVVPYKVWTAVSRALWIFGKRREGFESYKSGKERAGKAVSYLEKQASHDDQVILVAHGYLIHTMTREFKKRGWNVVQNNGKNNLGATILQK